jgi:hypothetical protein
MHFGIDRAISVQGKSQFKILLDFEDQNYC